MVSSEKAHESKIYKSIIKMKDNQKDGVILVNKPKGITSHDVVDIVRRRMNIRKVGHAGTLDPLAEGLLIILVGKYTKAFPQFVGFDKKYSGIMKLGEVTSTGDSQGELIETKECSHLTEFEIKEAFSFFEGDIDQIPPMVSALKVKGKRLYALARRGIVIKRDPRRIRVHSLKIIKIDMPYVELYVHCSKGTYVRKLAEDIGQRLGCGAHMVKILRLGIGPFTLDKACDLDSINESHLQKITI